MVSHLIISFLTREKAKLKVHLLCFSAAFNYVSATEVCSRRTRLFHFLADSWADSTADDVKKQEVDLEVRLFCQRSAAELKVPATVRWTKIKHKCLWRWPHTQLRQKYDQGSFISEQKSNTFHSPASSQTPAWLSPGARGWLIHNKMGQQRWKIDKLNTNKNIGLQFEKTKHIKRIKTNHYCNTMNLIKMHSNQSNADANKYNEFTCLISTEAREVMVRSLFISDCEF